MIRMGSDSDGNTYQVWKQEQLSSCGVASLWMAKGLVRQTSFTEDEWDLAQRVFRVAVNGGIAGASAGPQTFDPKAFSPKAPNQKTVGHTFSNYGLAAIQVAAALRADGLAVQESFSLTQPVVLSPHLLNGQRCAVILIQWDNGGGHFVVAARPANNGAIVFLDPWDGKVNERANTGRYTALYGNKGRIVVALYLS